MKECCVIGCTRLARDDNGYCKSHGSYRTAMFARQNKAEALAKVAEQKAARPKYERPTVCTVKGSILGCEKQSRYSVRYN